jgi:hypothetical protein
MTTTQSTLAKDGFSIPEEVAAVIALFDKEETWLFASLLFDHIFRDAVIIVSDLDSIPWHWIAKQDTAVLKSLLCCLVRESQKSSDNVRAIKS